MENSEFCERVFRIVAQGFDVPRDKLQFSSRYCEDLDGDELDQEPFVRALEQEFQVKLPEDNGDAIVTIGDSIKLIGGILALPSIDTYVDGRELAELGPAEFNQRQIARTKPRALRQEYQRTGFFKKIWMGRKF
ncbi:MAG TPA: hypothetical protein VGP72_28265 [Planctomycetota bacterium]